MHIKQLVHPIEPPQMTLAALPWSGAPSRRFRRLKSVFVPPFSQPPQSNRHIRSSSFPRRVLSSESASTSLASIVQMIASANISEPSPSSSSSFSRGLVHFSVQSCLGRRPLELELPLWSSVKDVKHAIEAAERHGDGGGVPAARLRIFYCGREWDNARTLHDLNLADGDVVYAVVADRSSLDGQVQLKARGSFVDAEETPLLRQCRQGLLTGLVPQLTLEGSGGTYCLRNARKVVIGMFKPSDEEPFAPNNPRGHTGQLGYAGFRRGVRSGEAALREVAASLLDRDGFSGVPFTTLVEMAHPALNWPSASASGSGSGSTKTGSLQQFVPHDELAGDLAPQSFPVREVHKIGVLDLRILNVDRNDSNILIVRPRGCDSVQKSGLQLVPIDHGYSFPRLLEVGWCDWVWLGWPQANVPFDSDTLKYIAAIDIAADHQLLRSRLGINELALRNARISTMLLQIGAAAGLTLFDIGSLASRSDLDQPSMLEIVTAQAEALAMEPPALRRSVSDGLVATQTHSSVASQSPLCSCDRDARYCACDTLQDEGVPAADLPFNLELFWSHIDMLLQQLVDDYSGNPNNRGLPSSLSSSSSSSYASSSSRSEE